MITNELHVFNNYLGYHVSFKTIKECGFVKREMNLDTHILENHHGRFLLIMNDRQYSRFLDNLTKWDEMGLIKVD